MTALVLTACAAMLATWVPHYLTWPLWSDADGFVMLAQAWDAGERPYRDIASNQFPGPIYGAWVLGKLFGWGRTVPLYAADAALVVLLGAVLLAWSRRVFGRALPGAVGFTAVLGYYLNLDYTQTLQRDWQAPLLVIVGLLALQAWPGRASRLGSALTFALALSIRPQVVLFLPAVALALDEGARPTGGPFRFTLRSWVEWAAACAALTALAFAPVVLEGLADDLWRGLRHASYGSRYNLLTWKIFFLALAVQLFSSARLLVPVLLCVELISGGAVHEIRRSARTWLVAYLFVFFYRPLSPLPFHAYLEHPLALVVAVLTAVLTAIVLDAGPRGLPASARLALVAALLVVVSPGVPIFCDPAAALRSVPYLFRGKAPAMAPPGYTAHPGISVSACYEWPAYRALLDYLRDHPHSQTRVANLLYGAPAVLGSTGRQSVFPCDAGIVWLYLIDPGAESEFRRSLERASDSLVVWIPDEPPPIPRWDLSLLRSVVPVHYEPAARFGSIEIWKRKPTP